MVDPTTTTTTTTATTTTTVETFPKATTTRDQVEAERKARLTGGAVSSTITEDATNYILTTVWNVIQP
jgi:hypothetical protein